MGYTTRAGVDAIAFGASGISETADAYAQSVRDPSDWQERIGAGRLATLRGWWLSDDDRRRKWLLQHLMCQGEVDAVAYKAQFGEPLAERIPDLEARLDPFVRDGLLLKKDELWCLTPLGRLFARVIAMSFDAYLPEQSPARPVFSRTV
jgi:oxygen-independent coproporphyrinogen-3 oxidase